MTIIIDGKKISDEILENLKEKTKNLDIKPTLAVIKVGDDPASAIYVRNKVKKAEAVGFNSILKELSSDTSKEKLLSVIKNLNEDKTVNAILLQLPLPNGLDAKDFLDEISPIKDVDGFTTYNSGKLFKGETPYAVSCTPKGIMTLLEKYNIQIEGKKAVIVGRSNIVGKPVASLLLKKNATVIQTHSKTKNLADFTRQADILITAIGKKEFIKKDMIKEGACIIDVGINRDDSGKIKGDVDYNEVKDMAGFITPVPGGVGPMTIASLLVNTYELYLKQKA